MLGRMKGKGRGKDLASMEESVRTGYRDEGLTPGVVDSFHRFLALFFAEQGRDLPWRRTTDPVQRGPYPPWTIPAPCGTLDPYHILVSEFMLQQTQVERVLVKYPAFLARFPDIETLAGAPLQEVLRAWQGLGYNRRALALHRTARRILGEFGGEVPLDRETLDSFPGIGSATAGAIMVFSTDRPEIFIETNIRRVYIHLFFPGAEKVHDREIEPILEKTLDREHPRRFYYTLMDYGSALGKGIWDPNGSSLRWGAGNQGGSLSAKANKLVPPPKKGTRNPNLRSASYARQSPFEGSDRQVRGAILRQLLGEGEIAEAVLRDQFPVERERLERILAGLERDGFIGRTGSRILLQDLEEGSR
jgi:A/G-specific adenine glycosylase